MMPHSALPKRPLLFNRQLSSLRQVQQGVTLVELIVVMLLLGILATGLTSYLRIGASMYVDGTVVQQTLQQSRFALERVVRELRGAVPNSLRVLNNADNSISCVEFTPLVQSGI